MTQTLSFKIALAFLIVSLAGIGLIAAMVAVLTTETFGAYVDAENKGEVAFELEHYYTAHGSWEGVDQPVHWPIGPSVHPAQPEFALLSTSGAVLIAGHNLIMGEAADPALLEHAVPIRVDGEVVGYFLPSEEDFGARPPAAAFLQPFYQALGMGALAAFGASLILGIAAAETITRPVRELTDATQAVAAGDLEHRVRVHSRDELGQLAEAFNRMATDLLASRSQRRQMTADIAHELRTPLSLILGHGEALSEGVLPATPETLHIIYDEAQRLNRLVEDLRVLSLTDANELHISREWMPPGDLVTRAEAAHRPNALRQGITITAAVAPDLPVICVDAHRMGQVLDNIIANALRYTPEGGTVTLSAARDGDAVAITVADSGPGLKPEEVARIFNRFYRTDQSRARHTGGSGLGLTIAQSLVEAHGGTIRAQSPPGEGLRVTIRLPVGG